MNLFDKKKLVLLVLISIILLASLGIQIYDNTVNSVEFGKVSVRTAATEGIEQSIQSGATKELPAVTNEGEIFLAREVELAYSNPETYYVGEFYSPPQVKVVLDCQEQPNCYSDRIEFKKDGKINVKTLCTTKWGVYECKIGFSEYDTDSNALDNDINFKPTGGFYENPLFNELKQPLERDLQSLLDERKQLLEKNPVEKAYLSFLDADYNFALEQKNEEYTSILKKPIIAPRKPYAYVAQTIIFLVRLGIVLMWTTPENQFFYSAQKKYNLKFPDGSKTSEEFVSKMKRIALERKEELKYRILEQEKEFEKKSVLDALDKILGDLSENVLKESLLVYDIKDSDSLELQVQKALVVWETESYSGRIDPALQPIISAENQIKWLNATGNNHAAEKITLKKQMQIDFGSLKPEYNIQVIVDQSFENFIEKQGNTVLIKNRLELFLKTSSQCNGTDCVYEIQLSRTAKPPNFK